MAVTKSLYYQRGDYSKLMGTPSVTPSPSGVPNKISIPTPSVTSGGVGNVSVIQPQVVPSQSAQLSVPTAPTVNPPSQNPHGTLWSGNALEKIFDFLRLPEYGYASFSQGLKENVKQQKSVGSKDLVAPIIAGIKNIIPGVQKRTQIGTAPGDFDLADNLGIQDNNLKTAVNLGGSLAVPAIPLGKILDKGGKILSKIPGLTNFVSGTVNALRTSKLAKPIETFVPYFRNPEAGKLIQQTEQQTMTRVGKLFNELSDASKNLSPEEQRIVGQMMENKVSRSGKLYEIAKPFIQKAEEIGNEAVSVGLLKKAEFEKFKGKYLTHIWNTAFSESRNPQVIAKRNVPQIIGNFFKKRTGKEGYVEQFAPVTFKGLGTEIKDIEAKKLFVELANKFGVKTSKKNVPAGYSYVKDAITNNKVASQFSRMALPNEIIDYLNRVYVAPKLNGLEKFADTALQTWKAAKTIYNPGYHVRNILSNTILSNMSTGKNLLSSAGDYLKSGFNYSGRGDQRFVKAAKDVGLIGRKGFYNSLQDLLGGAGMLEKKTGLRSVLGGVGEKIKSIQPATEESAKLSVFKTWIQKLSDQLGTTVDEALQNPEILKQAATKAEEAIFSPYRIGQAERNLFRNIVPFYSFTRQALPFTVKTALNHPERLTQYPKYKTAIESMSSDQGMNQDKRPSNLKGLIRLPGTDNKNNQKFFDPSYIYPWGNFAQDNSRGQLPFDLSFNPFVSEAIQQLWNYDPYLARKISESNIPEKALAERLIHIRRTMEPSFVTSILDKIIPALQGKPDYAGRARNAVQSVVDTLGLKTQNVNPNEAISKNNKQNSSQLRSIQSEYASIERDSSLSAEEKRKQLKRLRDIYNTELRSNR